MTLTVYLHLTALSKAARLPSFITVRQGPKAKARMPPSRRHRENPLRGFSHAKTVPRTVFAPSPALFNDKATMGLRPKPRKLFEKSLIKNFSYTPWISAAKLECTRLFSIPSFRRLNQSGAETIGSALVCNLYPVPSKSRRSCVIIFFSRRDTCTCVIPSRSAVWDWVFSPK